MAKEHFVKIGAATMVVAIGVVGMLSNPLRLQAQGDETRIQQGLAIAPVNLSFAHKDRNLVGLGSYLVNASGDCNGCHSSGTPASLGIYPYVPGGNPFFGQPEKLDPTVYLNGGVNFGAVGTPTGPLGYAGPNIISRNLTPNSAGLAEGGVTLSQFKQIMRTGIDLDGIHPNCTAAQLATLNSPPAGATLDNFPDFVCIPTGVIPGTTFDNEPVGSLLQVMPWPTFSHMTDHDLEAIYEYLSAIPCIDNTTSPPPAGAPNQLLNTCGVAAPAGVQAHDDVNDSRARQGRRH
jgi:hypothetical protein